MYVVRFECNCKNVIGESQLLGYFVVNSKPVIYMYYVASMVIRRRADT